MPRSLVQWKMASERFRQPISVPLHLSVVFPVFWRWSCLVVFSVDRRPTPLPLSVPLFLPPGDTSCDVLSLVRTVFSSSSTFKIFRDARHLWCLLSPPLSISALRLAYIYSEMSLSSLCQQISKLHDFSVPECDSLLWHCWSHVTEDSYVPLHTASILPAFFLFFCFFGQWS